MHGMRYPGKRKCETKRELWGPGDENAPSATAVAVKLNNIILNFSQKFKRFYIQKPG